MKLHFICPGAPKSATTTLYDILVQHSDIILPYVKETNFFSYTHLFNNGLNWYEHEYFPQEKKGTIVGDISTAYMTFSKIACKRIESLYGTDIKIIFLLRNPIDRAYSHYCMRRYNNNAEEEDFKILVERIAQHKRKFDEGLLCHLSKGYSHINSKYLDDWKYLHYFYNGLYNEIIHEFLVVFPKDNMKFIIFEDFISNPKRQILDILNFLNITPNEELDCNILSNKSGKLKYPVLHDVLKKISSNSTFKNLATSILGHVNTTRVYYFLKNSNRTPHIPPKIDPETRQLLYDFYEQEINDLQDTIAINLSHWSL